MSGLSAKLEKELQEYMKDFIFDSNYEKNRLYEFYKQLIIKKGWSSIYTSSFVFPHVESVFPVEIEGCRLDDFDDVAIISFFPQIAKKIADAKPFPKDKIGWNFLSTLFTIWLMWPGAETIDGTIEKNSTFYISDDYQAGMEWALLFPEIKNIYEDLVNIRRLSYDREFLKKFKDTFYQDNKIKHEVGERFWVDVVREEGEYKNIRAKLPQYLKRKKIEPYYYGVGIMLHGAENALGIEASLGRFVFQLGVSGTILEIDDTGMLVEINELGVYMKDSFDFYDDPAWYKPSQPLGMWRVPFRKLGGGVSVFNKSFRTYREITGMGRDFFILSKNKVIPLEPKKFLIWVPKNRELRAYAIDKASL